MGFDCPNFRNLKVTAFTYFMLFIYFIASKKVPKQLTEFFVTTRKPQISSPRSTRHTKHDSTTKYYEHTEMQTTTATPTTTATTLEATTELVVPEKSLFIRPIVFFTTAIAAIGGRDRYFGSFFLRYESYHTIQFNFLFYLL